MKEETEHEAELKMAEKLFYESNKRLKAAIKAKNLEQVSIVQSLLDVATQKMESARKKMEDCRKKKDSIDVKRRKLRDDLQTLQAKK